MAGEKISSHAETPSPKKLHDTSLMCSSWLFTQEAPAWCDNSDCRRFKSDGDPNFERHWQVTTPHTHTPACVILCEQSLRQVVPDNQGRDASFAVGRCSISLKQGKMSAVAKTTYLSYSQQHVASRSLPGSLKAAADARRLRAGERK